MSEHRIDRMKKWVLSYIENGDEYIHWSELACDAGNYDDAFNAGRAYQTLIYEGKIVDVNGTPQIKHLKIRKDGGSTE